MINLNRCSCIFSNRSVKHFSTKLLKNLSLETLNPNIKNIEYAIRGPIFQRACEIENELKQGVKKPYKQVYKLNIGDAQSLGQVPVTFLRQVISLVAYPKLLNDPKYPADAKERAETILANCPGRSIGSYSEASGVEVIRKHVAEFIEQRDGFKSNWEDIVLGHGASDPAKKFFALLSGTTPRSGVLLPVPEYPLYSAILAELGLKKIDYYLDEKNHWGIDPKELEVRVNEARKVCNPRAILVINPGNPTSHLVNRKCIEDVIKFAYKENLIIVADEVYQMSIHSEKTEFISFKKVLMELGPPYTNVELVSLNSVSKGFYAESGMKGGYAEVLNMDKDVRLMFRKSVSAMLCTSVLGQVAVDVMVKPPLSTEPSYEQFEQEKNKILDLQRVCSSIVHQGFNNIEGVSCTTLEGAIFSFPKIELPDKFISKCKQHDKKPDEQYVLELLNDTGICVIPGTGFGQYPGTYHFRMTVCPQPELLKNIMATYKKYHEEFLRKYS